MKISTLNSKLKLLAVGSNAKTSKGDDDTKLTAIMYLAPALMSGYNTCTSRSPGCEAACLFTAGRGAMNSVMQARINKTKLYFENNSEFIRILRNDLDLFNTYCTENNFQGYVRLNGTSDLYWETILDFTIYPDLKFYDYTKHTDRHVSHIPNYKLIYSRSEISTESDIESAFHRYKNVSVVFEEVPAVWKGRPVSDGDLNDLRWHDPENHYIALKAKGRAKHDTSGFVVRTI